MPFEVAIDLSMDSPEHFSKLRPEVAFIPLGLASRNAYGHRYGSKLLELDDAMLDELRQGQQLAVEICQDEYILFIQYRREDIQQWGMIFGKR